MSNDEHNEDQVEHNWKTAITLFLYSWSNVFIVCYSIRAVAADDFLGVFITDVMYGILGFSLFKKMQDASSKLEMAAYTAGVATGSQCAMHVYLLYAL